MSNIPTHLQIATRMQTLIAQWLGESFDLDRMLRDPAETREVLFVCQASNNPELVRLARQFVALGQPMPVLTQAVPPAPAAAKPSLRTRQEPTWAQDSSGFGLTAVLDGAASAPSSHHRAGWLNRPKWLRRDPPAALRS